MRAAVFALLLAACSGHGNPSAQVDAPSTPDALVDRCDSPAGTAAITAAHENLQPQYTRMYAGGLYASADSGQPPGFDLRPFFTNEALTTVPDVVDCEGGGTCTSVGILVDVIFLTGDELGAHAAQIHDSANTWQASGTVTLTDFVYPTAVVGHVAGSIHVDSTAPLVTIDGTFDHSFCLGLTGGVL